MCSTCEANGIPTEEIERQRRTVAEAVAEKSGVDIETCLRVMIAIEEFSAEFGAKQRAEREAEILESARAMNPELFAMLTAAGAEFVVEERRIPLDADGFPGAASAHERDVPEPRTGLYL